MKQGSSAIREPGEVFFFVRPEEAGHPRRQGSDDEVFCVFDSWLGDDLVSAHPFLLVTPALKEALASLDNATGFRPGPVRTSPSPFLAGQTPRLALPEFWALHIDGEPGADDMGLARDGLLVISQRTMDVLVRHRVGRATFSQFDPPPRCGARGSTWAG